ncbi:hypothetical protein JDV02_005072 [Purpureocillium takamizusanense]|uniref:Uncharacterized protein n=1 Tax=Purpureocillium takamizusanense TaxID=2060973 RepID=A0A9Q8QH78_9HYPO|nr:uncharacterized protein JDV02_005072 [Purpureocillium takamizusanense]UNI18826.1 hypothetical protein JDV02_005072 [Purpureocillium takamizusanense]
MGDDFFKWLQQIRFSLRDAGLLGYLDDTVSRPSEPGLKQIDFDRERALVNNVIYSSLHISVQQGISSMFTRNFNSVSPPELIRAVNTKVMWPALYYTRLATFIRIPSTRWLPEDDAREVMQEVHDEWDLIRVCERGVSDDVYIGVVMALLHGTEHEDDLLGDIVGEMEHYNFTASELRAWLTARFGLEQPI